MLAKLTMRNFNIFGLLTPAPVERIQIGHTGDMQPTMSTQTTIIGFLPPLADATPEIMEEAHPTRFAEISGLPTVKLPWEVLRMGVCSSFNVLSFLLTKIPKRKMPKSCKKRLYDHQRRFAHREKRGVPRRR